MTLKGFRRYVRNQKGIMDALILSGLLKSNIECSHEWEIYLLNPEPRYYDAYICRKCGKIRYERKGGNEKENNGIQKSSIS